MRNNNRNLKFAGERTVSIFDLADLVTSRHGLNLGMAENVKNEGRAYRKEPTKTYATAAFTMWEVLPDGFPNTKCWNHLSMRSSLAIRLTNTKIP